MTANHAGDQGLPNLLDPPRHSCRNSIRPRTTAPQMLSLRCFSKSSIVPTLAGDQPWFKREMRDPGFLISLISENNCISPQTISNIFISTILCIRNFCTQAHCTFNMVSVCRRLLVVTNSWAMLRFSVLKLSQISGLVPGFLAQQHQNPTWETSHMYNTILPHHQQSQLSGFNPKPWAIHRKKIWLTIKTTWNHKPNRNTVVAPWNRYIMCVCECVPSTSPNTNPQPKH